MRLSRKNKIHPVAFRRVICVLVFDIFFQQAIESHAFTVEHDKSSNCRYAQRTSTRLLNGVSNTTESKLVEVDVRYNQRLPLVYDSALDRYLPCSTPSSKSSLIPFLRNAFIPQHVQPSYFIYIRWRILQRFISAVVHVFGTQCLLLGLGQKNSSLGLSAALSWVLKDALGKVVRMGWASKMGHRFDPDAKRWRYRSAFLFAIGNGLEICAFINPTLFIIYAILSNCLKQMSMLTSSATRNALYNTFKEKDQENIGDITAKGEAQIAIVDLLGIGSGVCLSKFLGISIKRVLAVYFCLQSLEIVAMYHEIRSVVFRVLNFDRLYEVISAFVEDGEKAIVAPNEMAKKERIFLPPKHLARHSISFGSLGRVCLNPDELSAIMTIFQDENFLLVVGQNLKKRRRFRSFFLSCEEALKENCHIVLHTEANNMDIIKSTLALINLRKKLSACETIPTRCSDCIDLIKEANRDTNEEFRNLLTILTKKGWSTPSKFMFGRLSMRAEWQKLKSDAEQSLIDKRLDANGASMSSTLNILAHDSISVGQNIDNNQTTNTAVN